MLRNRIKSAGVKGIAPQNTPDCHRNTTNRTVFIYCLISIMRARRIKPAGIGRKQAGKSHLIAPYHSQADKPGKIQELKRQIPQTRFRGQFRKRFRKGVLFRVLEMIHEAIEIYLLLILFDRNSCLFQLRSEDRGNFRCVMRQDRFTRY